MKVGVFDSGLGGLTIVQSLIKVIKGAEIYYVADTKNAPYGEKPPEQILQYSLDITQYLVGTHQIDSLVIACNTATSAAVKHIRTHYPSLLVVGTEPGIKPAFEQSKTGKVGVLATPATLKGEKYQQLASSLCLTKEVTLFEQACPGLVEQIERGEMQSERTKMMLENWLAPMRESDVDTIVLGCTHYPLVSDLIENVMQRRMNLIHTGDAIAQHVLALSKEHGHVNEGELGLKLYTTGKISKESVKHIFGEALKVETISL